MRTFAKLATLLLALASFSVLAPPASAACATQEIVYAHGGATLVAIYDCRYDMYYTVERDGQTVVHGRCTFVQEIRVLGTPVPGTGQYHCVPDVGIPAVDERSPDAPGVHTCLTARVLGVDLVPAGTPCVSYCKPETTAVGVTCWVYF